MTHPPSLSPLELESRDPAYCLQFLLITPTTLPFSRAVSRVTSKRGGEGEERMGRRGKGREGRRMG